MREAVQSSTRSAGSQPSGKATGIIIDFNEARRKALLRRMWAVHDMDGTWTGGRE